MSRTRSSSNLWAVEALLAASLLGASPLTAAVSRRPAVVVQAPCTPAEKWELESIPGLPDEVLEEFLSFVEGDRLPYTAFAQVTALRGGFSGDAASLADYWMGRALFAAGLYPAAAIYFDNLVSIRPRRQILPVQMAAMACLLKVHAAAPHIDFSDKALNNLAAYYEPWLVPKEDLPILWEATVHLALRRMGTGDGDGVEGALGLLEASGPYEPFVQGLWAIRQEEMEVAASALTKLFAFPKLPPSIAERSDELRVLLGSALYGAGNFAAAVQQLEKVDKQSNELLRSLTLIASAQLLAGDLSKALGTAAGLKSGAFRSTFAPEAFMVYSMALNELCRYPEALDGLPHFKREYGPSYRWLKKWLEEEPGKREPLYPIALSFLDDNDVPVPSRIVGEWIRSPLFIAHQRSINALLEEPRRISALVDQIEQAREALDEEKVRLMKKLGDGSAGPSAQVTRRKRTDAEVEKSLARLEKARDLWKAILKDHERRAGQESRRLALAVERHLTKIAERMFLDLRRIIENYELIVAEVLSGAGQDLVFRGANPDFVRESEESGGRGLASLHSDVAGEAGDQEIWEDELGALQADVPDGCPKKAAPKAGRK